MNDELTQLKDDLAKLLEAAKIYDARYKGADWKATLGIIESRIAKIEAEAADPWRKAKDIINRLRENRLTLNTDVPKIICGFFDHLTAENARLAARVAELEDVKDVADMQPPFDGPIVGLEPVLDPARVLATAEELMWGPTVYAVMLKPKDAKPYRLKGGGQ